MATLFNDYESPAFAARLAPQLRLLANRGVSFGTSSWKYEGWLGTIYTAEQYLTRRKFSRKKFEAECLREYAATFPVVGGDFSFYQFPKPSYWAEVFSAVPSTFAFGLKVPESITVTRWPAHARYGSRAGERNDAFLDAGLFDRQFVKALEPFRSQVAALIFEFGQFGKTDFPTPADFFKQLNRFLGALPAAWPYAIEIRNKDYLTSEYFRVLARHNVSHVFNAWTRMPSIAEQIAIPDAFTANFCVVRALLQHGWGYEKAVKQFEPYREVQLPDPSTRTALRQIADRALRTGQRAYVFVNNRLEGNAPGTIEAVVSAGL